MGQFLAVVRRFRWQQWLIVVALVAALAFAAFNVVSAVHHARAVRAHAREPIAEWMTLGHVARAYGVSVDVLDAALGVPPGQRDRRPLRMIAADRGESFAALRARLLVAIERAGPAASPTPRPAEPGGPR